MINSTFPFIEKVKQQFVENMLKYNMTWRIENGLGQKIGTFKEQKVIENGTKILVTFAISHFTMKPVAIATDGDEGDELVRMIFEDITVTPHTDFECHLTIDPA